MAGDGRLWYLLGHHGVPACAGCTLSSAIATLVVRQLMEENPILSDKVLVLAIEQAKKYVTAAIREGSLRNIGKGNGSLWHLLCVDSTCEIET